MSLPVIRVSAAACLNCFQEETFASAPLLNSLWAGAFEHFTKYMGSNRLQLKCAPTSAWAAFTARNEEWEKDTLYCLFIWIHSAIPNDKEGPGRKKNKIGLYKRYLSVQIISEDSLILASHGALLKHPQLYEVSTFQLVSIIYHCKVSKGFNTSLNHRI